MTNLSVVELPEKPIGFKQTSYREIEKEELRQDYLQEIEDFKQTKSHALILEHIGVELRRPAGFKLFVKIYDRNDQLKGKGSSLIVPESYRDKDLWNSRIGLVLAMGKEAYNPDRFPDGPYCDIGDYIYFTRHDSSLSIINGIKVAILNDDKCLTPINDPQHFVNELQIGV